MGVTTYMSCFSIHGSPFSSIGNARVTRVEKESTNRFGSLQIGFSSLDTPGGIYETTWNRLVIVVLGGGVILDSSVRSTAKLPRMPLLRCASRDQTRCLRSSRMAMLMEQRLFRNSKTVPWMACSCVMML